MRLRHKPWAEDKIKEYSQYIPAEPSRLKGAWKKLFAKNQPIHIEVGTGKGQFIVEMARRHPEINFIGIELQSSVLVSALDKQIEADLPNLKFLYQDGEDLTQFFEAGEVDRIYLTFSDPWPKTRHEKRRLTYKKYLAVYQQILKHTGELHFKTDNRGLFEYSLVSMSAYGMELKEVYLNLHQSVADEVVEENVMTEYEEKFSTRGNTIYKVIATFK